jgi:tetratricopeptide (TPR) repeat protein/transcriptional regulator with XRE-family HTH domain
MVKTDFGQALRKARQRSLLTLERLAEASGVSVRAISDMERGRSLPRQATLRELMDALDLNEDDRGRFVQAAARHTRQAPQQLPPDLAAFRGHEDVLARVHGFTPLVTNQASNVVITAVGGMAGVGKTTLAVHWAHQVTEQFPDGQLYVDLRGFDPSGQALDPGEALGGFLSALGVPSNTIPQSTEQRSALFREQCASRDMVVVLDNAQTAEQVRPLLPASSRCLTIITSRNQLTGLVVAEDASLISLDVWTEAEALEALAARIGDERSAAEPEAGARLVNLCGRLPLAIAVVAAHLGAAPDMPLRVAVRELQEAQSRLDPLSTDDPRVDVRGVFSWSYHALSPMAARFFRRLGVHPGPALCAEAAASVAGESMPTSRRLLRELTWASLLSRDGEGRYVLHDLVRAYAAELLDQEGDDRFEAERRVIDYFRHNADGANRALVTRPTVELTESPAEGVVLVPFDDRMRAMDWYRLEERSIMAALHTMEDPRLLHSRMNLATHLVTYFSAQGQWADEIAARQIALDAALVLGEPVAITENSASVARALAEIGQAERADEQVDLMLRHIDSLSLQGQANTERSIGWVRGRQGRHSEALHHARTALGLYRRLPDVNHVARELNAVGWYLALLGRYREALAMCEEAIPILQRTGNRRSEAATWDSIGFARHHLGDLDAAVTDYKRSLRLYEEVLDRYNQAEVLDHLASAQLELGDVPAARASWEEAVELLSAIGSPRAAQMRTRAEAAALPPGDAADTRDSSPH